jgi:hypothetical protein
MAESSNTTHISHEPFRIIDMGKSSRKQIRRLRKKEGKLVPEVNRAVADAVADLGDEARGKKILPIVILYKKKRKSGKGGGLPFPLPLPFKF